MSEVAQLANSVAVVLGPALPFLLGASSTATDGAIRKMGADTWDLAKRVWLTLGSRVTGPSRMDTAARRVAANSDDPRLLTVFEVELEDLFTSDAELADTLEEVMRSFANRSDGQERVIKAGDVSRSVLIAGDQNRVQYGPSQDSTQ